MIVLIDNYDSFSYNLVQLAGGILKGKEEIRVIRNDERTVPEIEALGASRIILSPGPGRPSEAGVCEELIRMLAGRTPILGVCLGHQAICEAFGASITYAARLMHGKQSEIRIDPSCPIFLGLKETIRVARYHSLAADRNTIPEDLVVTGTDPDGEIMAVRHRTYPIYGLQFHPESVMTPDGERMLQNFLECVR